MALASVYQVVPFTVCTNKTQSETVEKYTTPTELLQKLGCIIKT